MAPIPTSRGFILTILVYLALSGLAWAASTPPGGVPDEPAHVVYSAAVVRGELGEATDVDDPVIKRAMRVEVPQWATTIVVCYGFDRSVTADCQPGISNEDQEVPTTTTATKYPPPYYAAVGLPTLWLSGAPAFYAMRVISVVFGVVLIGLGLAAAAPVRRWWLALGVVVAYTPMAAHLLGSVNPNGFETAATLGLGAGLLGLESENGSRSRVWFQASALAVLAAAVAWARPWSILLLAGVAGLCMLANWRSLTWWAGANRVPGVALLALVVVAATTALLFQTQVQSPASAEVISELPTHEVPFDENLDAALELSGGWMMAIIGLFGWVDHVPPSLVVYTWLAFLATFVIIALAVSRTGMRLLLLAVLIGTTILAPLFAIEFLFGSTVGYQARYHLAVVVMVPLLAFLLLGSAFHSSGTDNATKRAAWWFAGLAPLLMLLSVLWSIARYSIGAPFGWTDLVSLRFLTDARWLPPGEAGIVATVSLLGLVAMAPVVSVMARREQPMIEPSGYR